MISCLNSTTQVISISGKTGLGEYHKRKKKNREKKKIKKLLSPAAEQTSHKLGVESCGLSPFGLRD